MELQALVADSFARLADTLEAAPADAWDRPSLCAGWTVRNVVAHVTMAARLTPEQFGAEMAAAGGDFQVVSDTVAERDGALPVDEHLAHLRSTTMAEWQPPGGGAIGALNHVVVHGLDVTNALGVPAAHSPEAAGAILDSLADGVAKVFGIDLSAHRLEATDLDRTWGDGEPLTGTSAELISLATHRTLPDGRTLAG